MHLGCGVVYHIYLFFGNPWFESLRRGLWGTLDRVMSTEGSRWLGDIGGTFVGEMCQINTDCLLSMTSEYRHQGGGVGHGCELKKGQDSSRPK